MAKIQNPQDQLGNPLSTIAYVVTEIDRAKDAENELGIRINTNSSSIFQNTKDIAEVESALDIHSADTSVHVSAINGNSYITCSKIDDTIAVNANTVTDLSLAEDGKLADSEAIKKYVDEADETLQNSLDVHIADEVKHFKDGEHEQLFSDTVTLFDSTSISTGETNQGTYNGVLYTPQSDLTIDEISITRGPNAMQIVSKYLAIFTADKNFVSITDGGATFVDDVCTWEVNSAKLNAGTQYRIIFVENKIETYSPSAVNLKTLKCESNDILDFINNGTETANNSKWMPEIKFSGSARLFALKDELDSHVSNTVMHVTQDDKDKWNDISDININNLYDKDDNIVSVNNETIKFSDGTSDITTFKPENIISAQYTFRTTKGDSSNLNDNSKLTEFNLRTIYTSTNGATTNGGSIDEVDDGIELYKGSDGYYHYRTSVPVEYEQDLLWKDDEEYQTLGSLINGTGMFMRNKLKTFNDDLTCLTTAKGMFGTNRELTDFKSPLPSLVNAKSMFTGCRALTVWRVKLPSLVIGSNMFSDLEHLMELSSVDTCLPNLTMARQMFAGCPKLTKFHVPSTSFSNLYDAREMFYGCPIASINGNFESLEDGTNMLSNAHLDLASIKNIAETIRDWSEGYPAGINDEDGSPQTILPKISLGIGFTYVVDDENVIAIGEELAKIRAKGWDVLESWNGPAGVSTVDENNKGFFAQLYDSGEFNTYITEDGNPCSIITTDSLRWISDKDSWSPMVSSMEEAAAYFNLTKIENTEETTEETN